MNKKFKEFTKNTKVLLRLFSFFVLNIFRDKLDLTPEECELSAYIFSVCGMCHHSIYYCDAGLAKTGITSDVKASLCMSMALSLLTLKKKDDAERYFETAHTLLRQQYRSKSGAILNAQKNKMRYTAKLLILAPQNAQESTR